MTESGAGAHTYDESASYHFLPQAIFSNRPVGNSNKAHFPQRDNCWHGPAVPDFWIYVRINIAFFLSIFHSALPNSSQASCHSVTNKQTTRNRFLLGNNSSVNYEIPQILWDLTVHYRLNNSLQFFLILNQTKAVCALPSCVSRSSSILSPRYTKVFQVVSLLRDFPLKPCMHFFSPSADHSNDIWWLHRLKFAYLLLQICKNVCYSYTSFISI